MLPSELLVSFRSMMRDESTPPLWTDDDILQYMTRAQDDLARVIGGISDSRSNLTYITMQARVAYYPVSQRILKIEHIYRDDTGEPIQLMNSQNLDSAGSSLRDPVGRTTSAIVGMDQDFVRLDPVPDETEAGKRLRMHIYRLPLPVTHVDDCGETHEHLEIHEHHHLHLLIGMAAQAHMKQDAETFDAGRS